MNQLAKAVLLGGGTILAGWIGWGIYAARTAESIPYERIDTRQGLELRAYPQTVLVETTAPNERTAFRRLFRYIDGANEGSDDISMTAPVETQDGDEISMTAPVRSDADDEEIRMAFYLPPEYDAASAPEPTDETVQLVTEPPKTVAVDRFSWVTPDWRVDRRKRKLQSSLDAAGLTPQGDPSLLRYNDPWTPPFMRRNEIAVAVDDLE